MDISFCVWAPWVFSALAGIAGWLLRWWFDDQKINDLHGIIKTKDADIYHLNEAHTLLQNDKAKRLEEHAIESDIKERSIAELRQSLEQSETSNKTLLAQIVDSKKQPKEKIVRSANLVSSTPPAATVTHSKEIHKEDSATKPTKSTKSTKSSNSKRLRRKIRKYRKSIHNLKLENSNLRINSGASETSEKIKEVTKEIPVTIIKTIKIKEKIDRKKLKKLIKKLPLIKSKKTVSKKKKRGKARIVG